MVFLIVAVLAALCLFGFGAWLFCIAFVRSKGDSSCDLSAKENEPLLPYREIIEGGMTYVESTPHEKLSIKSFDGLRLAARYYKCGNSRRTILLFHGYRSAARRDFSCAVKMYTDMGLNVLLVDQRAHGESEGKIITFGIKERRDVLYWCRFVLQKYGDDFELYLGGLSMGCSTVLMALGLDLPQNVKGVVADCGYTSPPDIIHSVASRYMNIKSPIAVPFINIFCMIFGGFSVYETSVPKSLKDNKIPILFIHGKNDSFVPCEMTVKNYESTNSDKKMVLVENADHGMSFLVDTEVVFSALKEFLME